MSLYKNMLNCKYIISTLGFTLTILLSNSSASLCQQTQQEYKTALCDSGRIWLLEGDLHKARLSFEEVLQLDRDFQPAVLGLGQVFLEMGTESTLALRNLRRATELKPADPSAHYYKALAHIQLEKDATLLGHARSALSELDIVLEYDPSHSDAHYRKGLIFVERFGDGEMAEIALNQQISAYPQHIEARFLLLKIQMDQGRWDEAKEEGEEILGRESDFPEVYPYLAGAYWKSNMFQESMDTFERYFTALEEEERNLYLDMGLILTPTEQDEFISLNNDGRKSYWAHYWRIRDPDPTNDVNERLLEHYIRIAWARLEFGNKVWPWDDRGSLYVRYGDPGTRSGPGMPYDWISNVDSDPIIIKIKRDFYEEMGLSSNLAGFPIDLARHDPAGGMGRDFKTPDQLFRLWVESTSPEPERWLYPEKGIDLSFDNTFQNGRFLLDNPSRTLVTQMEQLLPTLSAEEDKIETIDPMAYVVTFRGSQGRTIVEYSFALLPDEFGAFQSPTGAYATIDVEVNLYSETWELIAKTDERAKRLRTIPQIQIRGIPVFVDATRMEVNPGTYRLTTMLLDPETGKRATTDEMVELPDYSGRELMVSSILPAARITQILPGREGTFIRGELEVLPLPGRTLQVDQPLFIYYEIYNLSKDQYGATDYKIDYSVAEAPQDVALTTRLFQGLASLVGVGRKRAVITSSVPGSGITRDVESFLEIDMSGLPPQTYELELQITDTLNGKTATSYLLFRTLPPPDTR